MTEEEKAKKEEEQTKEAGFEAFLKRNDKVICKVCWQYGKRDRYYFFELYQEVSMALWNEYRQYGLSRLRKGSSEGAWVNGIARNVAANYWRAYGTALHYVPYCEDELDALLDEDGWDIDALYDSLLPLMNEEEKRIIESRMQGKSYAEIAQQEGLTEDAIRMRIHRIVMKLKEKQENL